MAHLFSKIDVDAYSDKLIVLTDSEIRIEGH